MKFSLKASRSKSTHSAGWFPDFQHPDLPLSPAQQQAQQQQHQHYQEQHHSSQPDPAIPRQPAALNRSISVHERSATSVGLPGDRRSIAVLPSAGSDFSSPSTYPFDDAGQPSPHLAGGLTRSQTVVRREATLARSTHAPPPLSPGPFPAEHSLAQQQRQQQPNKYPYAYQGAENSPSAAWSPDFTQLPTPQEQHEHIFFGDDSASMSAAHHAANTPGKTSSDSGPHVALDRWSQRRLQRLNTEQGFREQRQGGAQGVLSPPSNAAASISSGSSDQTVYNAPAAQYHQSGADAQPQQPLHHPSQPHPAQHQQSGYQAPRVTPGNTANVGLAIQTPSTTNPSRSQQYPPSDSQSHASQYSPPESHSHFAHDPAARPSLASSRSFSQQQADDTSMSNNATQQLPKATRSANGNNRQSVHNGISSREGSHSTQGGQVPAFTASVVPPTGQGQPFKGNAGPQTQQPPQSQPPHDVGRGTPQPSQLSDEMSDEDIAQLIKDHKELREKYTKVKKYYFEKEDQVKQLQNSLAHQRLSQSRTSLDDSEYTTRFNRLDGLIAQLAFSIRKSWKSIPQWLVNSVNRDAVATGKQEMTAAGRAFISCWLVEEVFDKYFHPDLEPSLSSQLKGIQRNIRKSAPISQTAEEEEYLISKVVNWRLATLEGLGEALRSPTCPDNRQKLTDTLKDGLVSALALHLQDPPPSDLEGGVHMIIELVVSIAIHLPLESRDVVIEYFMPGYSIMNDQMKVESGIPQLITSVAEDAADRASLKSATSDLTDMTENSNTDQPSKKRSMLSALTGTGGKSKAQGKHSGAAGSSSSLGRPESSQGMKEDAPPRVRMAAGIGVSVRGRSVLVKAPVFST